MKKSKSGISIKIDESKQLKENASSYIQMASNQSQWTSLFKGLYDSLRDSKYNITGKEALFEIINLMVLCNIENKLEIYNDKARHPIFRFTEQDKFSNILFETKKAIQEANYAIENGPISAKHTNEKKLEDCYSNIWTRLYDSKKHMRETRTSEGITYKIIPDEFPCTFAKIAKHPSLWKMITVVFDDELSASGMIPIESITKFHILDKSGVSSELPKSYGRILLDLMKKIDKVLYTGPEENRRSIFELSTKFDGFGKAYEDMLKDTGDADKKKNGEFFTRRDICELIIDELKPEINETFADLSCGTGGFFYTNMEYHRKNISKQIDEGILTKEEGDEILKTYSSSNMRGIEIDPKNYKLLCLNLLIQAPNADILEKFEKKNSLLVLSHTGLLNSIDVIGGNPPYGAKPEVERAFITSDERVIGLTEAQTIHSEEPKKKGTKGKISIDSYWGSLDKGKSGVVKNSTAQFMMLYLRSLKVGGRCGIVIDRGILINGNDPSKKSWERDFRMEFMNLSEIWKIILLPKGIFETTSFDTAIIFFRKGFPTTNVEFVEGYFKKQDKGKGNKKMYLKVLGIVSREKIEEKLFSLDPKDYFGNEESIEGEQFMIPCEWKKLEDVCEFKNGIAFPTSEMDSLKKNNNYYKILKIANLQYSGKINYNVDSYLNIESSYSKKTNIFFIKQFSFITALSGSTTGKICLFESEENILANQRLCIFYTEKYNLVKYLLMLTYFSKKILGLSSGNAQPNISDSKIKDFKIPVPTNIEDQERIVMFCDYIFGASDIKPDFITFDIERQNYHIDIAINFADNLFRYLLNEQYVEFIEKVKLAHQISYLPDIPIEIKMIHIDEEYEKNPDSIYDAFIMKEWKKITKDIEMEMKPLEDIARIEYGTRITKSENSEVKTDTFKFPVYGGGDITFYTNVSNRPIQNENMTIIISRFAMSEKCVRIKNENIFLNDSALSLHPININHSYLGYVLKYFQKKIYSFASGQGQKNIQIFNFQKMRIPIPTNPDDINRIVEYLDRKSSAFKELYQ
jgi:type I restriction-modification system DNA methylase subunit